MTESIKMQQRAQAQVVANCSRSGIGFSATEQGFMQSIDPEGGSFTDPSQAESPDRLCPGCNADCPDCELIAKNE